MASTVLADLDFNSNHYTNIMAGAFTNRRALLMSGILKEIPDTILNRDIKGYFAHIPHYSTLSGSSVQITTSLSSTINNLASYDNVAAWIEREKAWGADQMNVVAAGADPAEEIMRQIGEYWANELVRVAIQNLGGAFTTALLSLSTGATYAGAPITLPGGVAARQLLGDNQDALQAVVMNSKVKSDALLAKILTELANTQGAVDGYNSGSIEMFLGSRVYASDQLSATASVYPTYFGAEGAVGFKFRNRNSSSQTNSNVSIINAGGLNIEVEKARVSTTAGGQDLLISRASFFAHPMGTAWTTATENPTDAQLATDSNWTKTATDDKLIKITQLLTL